MKKTNFFSVLLVSLCLTGVASAAAWLRLPACEAEPLNLANPIIIGTQVQSYSRIIDPSALLANSSAEAATLPAGKSEAVISMGEQQLIEQVSFLNDGAASKLVISASTDLKEWTPLAQATFVASDRYVPVKFAAAHAKYIQLAFETGTSSSIRNVKLGGSATTKDYKAVTVKEGVTVDVNLTSSSLGARPIYMFPTPTNVGENGGQKSFTFPKSNECFRTVVYDLGAIRTIKKFNAAYSRVPTRIEAYAFEQLPEKKDWRGKMTLDPVIFDEMKAVATAEDARGQGSIQIVLERPVQAQYVALRFEPNYDKRAVAGLDPNWKAMAFPAVVPIAVIVRETSLFEQGAFTEAADESGDEFVVYDAAAGGTVPLVLLSRSAIALVSQQLGPNASEGDAEKTILNAAGFTPFSNSSTGTVVPPPDTTSGVVTNPSTETANSSNSPTSTAGLNALGLSAYRGSGGSNGKSPFGPLGGPTQATSTTTDTSDISATRPLVIAPTSP